jgi:hypothetical protein
MMIELKKYKMSENVQQILKSYTDKKYWKIKYEENMSNDKFIMRVIIQKIDDKNQSFNWTLPQNNKKIAKNEAAKIALLELNIETEKIISNIDLLIEIRDLLLIINNKL